MDKAAGSALVAALLLAAAAFPGQGAPNAAPQSMAPDEARAEPPRAAEPARLAARGLLIAIAAAGRRLVAVGDRGIIVLSDDRGASWRQAEYVPTQALLTGVCFLDTQHGVAVGHDELILTTDDAGRNWKRAHYAPQAQRPLLDVWCGAGGEVIAVGAYSAYFASADAGASWREVKFMPSAPAALRDRHVTAAAPTPAAASGSEQGAGGGYHLNRIVAGNGRALYIAAEAGHLYASDDGGASWRTLASPYEGSFFGVLPLPGRGFARLWSARPSLSVRGCGHQLATDRDRHGRDADRRCDARLSRHRHRRALGGGAREPRRRPQLRSPAAGRSLRALRAHLSGR